MSILLRLSYSHRISTYGSLSTTDRTAVDSLFGWSKNELSRDQLLATACLKTTFVNDTCEIPATHVLCERVKLRKKGGMFDQTVMIPAYISDCLIQANNKAANTNNDQQCASLFSTFLSAYSEPNTLFQLRPTRCFREYLYTNFSRTRDWFANKFWQRDVSASNVDGLNAKRIQVAMHVRRGDFFNYTNRVLIGDGTFVDVAGRLSEALDDIIGTTVPITIHMFSEGVSLQGERVKDNHDTSKMAAVYVDENGHIIRDESYWTQLFRTHTRWKRRQHVEVKTHIASDTIEAVKLMVRSDFFIGSISGLSVQVIRHIGRGLMLLPVHETEVGEEEHIVTFDYGRHGYDSFLREDKLYKMVARAVRRNRLACSVW